MAATVKVIGLDQVLANLNKEIAKIEGDVQKGLTLGMQIIKRDSMLPVLKVAQFASSSIASMKFLSTFMASLKESTISCFCFSLRDMFAFLASFFYLLEGLIQ